MPDTTLVTGDDIIHSADQQNSKDDWSHFSFMFYVFVYTLQCLYFCIALKCFPVGRAARTMEGQSGQKGHLLILINH